MKEKKSLENDQLMGHFQSIFFFNISRTDSKASTTDSWFTYLDLVLLGFFSADYQKEKKALKMTSWLVIFRSFFLRPPETLNLK